MRFPNGIVENNDRSNKGTIVQSATMTLLASIDMPYNDPPSLTIIVLCASEKHFLFCRSEE